MSKWTSKIKTDSESFHKNTQAMSALVEECRTKTAQIITGGNTKGRDRHVQQGKLLPRDRITKLVDPGSAFLELSTFAGYELYKEAVPCGGLISGIGTIENQECVIVVNDATVKRWHLLPYHC